MKRIKFLRRDVNKISQIGKGRKKKQLWRKPKGRDNKMREKRKGKPQVVSIGYGRNKKDRGKENGKKIFVIQNLKDLKKITKEDIGLIGKVGKKKKIQIIQEANKQNILLKNSKVKEEIKQKNNGVQNESEK